MRTQVPSPGRLRRATAPFWRLNHRVEDGEAGAAAGLAGGEERSSARASTSGAHAGAGIGHS